MKLFILAKKNDCGQNDEWTAHWLKNRRDFNLLQTKEWATLIWNPCSIDIFSSNRIIKGHSFSLDSQHETAMSLIVITQAGNFPFNHDLHNTKGFVFSSAKSKEKDKESLIENYFPLQKLQGEWVQAFGAMISGIAWVVALTTTDQS